jgi:CRISPR/Cas system CSM-associated protein Csm3 (group 7 of RAMP superfamily)
MRFTITFHGPFRVAAGAASDGLNATYDAANPLPSSSLKGVMRASAKTTLGIQARLVNEIFGDKTTPSPWWWSDAVLQSGPAGNPGPERIRTQLRIDPATFTAAATAVRTSGELWPPGARFEVRRRGEVPGERVALHEAVLAASARTITALGSDRRRGLGWVSVIPDQPWDDAQQQLLLSCRGDSA